MLDTYINDSNSLKPYLKQFVKYLNGNKVLDYSANKGNVFKELESLKYNVINKNEYGSSLFDGIVVDNIDNKYDKNLFDELYNLLYEEGKILLIMHVEKSNKCYDDETEDDYIRGVKDCIEDKFLIKEELVSSSSWKFIIIIKNTIK